MDTLDFQPLIPVNFLQRSAAVFPERLAIVDGALRITYAEFYDRVRRLSAVLRSRDIGPGDRVAVLCTNSHVMLELHNGVPGIGAVLVPLNTRLATKELAYIVGHSGATLIVATTELAGAAQEVAALTGVPLLMAGGPEDTYEALLRSASPADLGFADELAALGINYTSGTTGQPKGAVVNHRGAYLQALAMAYHARMSLETNYLWTLPMFHCNGWCFTWAVTAAGGCHVCLRTFDATDVWRTIESGEVTHMCAAPAVLTMILEAARSLEAKRPPASVAVLAGGSPPSPTLLASLARLGISVTHLYGMTETMGPIAINEWQPEWDELGDGERSSLRARQGIPNIVTGRFRVVTPDGVDVPPDGATVGELVLRGNTVMSSYYRDAEATASAALDGWLRTGDLAVMHANGYMELTDRLKDVIITGGENVSSVEVERVLAEHPEVVECAVVAAADDRWGEVPVAFVTLRREVPEGELIDFVRDRLTHFKAPKPIVEGPLPKTSTGKIQKAALRDRLRNES